MWEPGRDGERCGLVEGMDRCGRMEAMMERGVWETVKDVEMCRRLGWMERGLEDWEGCREVWETGRDAERCGRVGGMERGVAVFWM